MDNILVNREQLALFGPSPAERERYRREVLEGRFGMPAREAMVRRKNWGIVQRTPEPPLRNAWRATPETPAPPRPMHLHFAKPPKKFGEMTDEEIDEFAAHFVKGMARQVGRDES